MKQLFERLVAKGYPLNNKRVIGNPLYTSEETSTKDFLQEIGLICEWLRINHGIWINVTNAGTETFSAGIYNTSGRWLWDDNFQESYCPKDAYLLALEYVLNNLI